MNSFKGSVNGETVEVLADNKKAAMKIIRNVFLARGIPTRPNLFTDLLEMEGGNQMGYRARHPELPHTALATNCEKLWIANNQSSFVAFGS
jgi:hypothetical protein